MEGPGRIAGPSKVVFVGSTTGVFVISSSPVAVGLGVLVETALGVEVFSSPPDEDAEVAGASCVGSNRAVMVLSGVGNENGVGVENPGKVQPVSTVMTIIATIMWRGLILFMELHSSMRLLTLSKIYILKL